MGAKATATLRLVLGTCLLLAVECLIPSPSLAMPGKRLIGGDGRLVLSPAGGPEASGICRDGYAASGSRPTRLGRAFVPTMALSVGGGVAAGVKSRAIVASATAAAASTPLAGGLQLLLSKVMGYCMLVGSLFLQAPQIIKIVSSKSVLGISRASRYSEVPINSSACIYHILMKLPFSTWGENFAVLIQNLTIVGLVWLWETPRVKWTEIVGMTAAFVALCAIQFSLPPALYPWLMYINLPLGISSNLPQIVTNFRQKHTGQVAVVSNILKFIGCSVRIFTTLTQIGLDAGLIANYALGATMNIIIVAQCWIYRKQTAKVLAEDRKAHGLPSVNKGTEAEGTEAEGSAEKPFDPDTSLWKPKT